MPAKKKSLPSFYFPFIKLFSGSVVVQFLNLAFSLLLPKYYTPGDYAVFGIFTAAVFILVEIICLKLDITIFLPKSDYEAIEIIHAIFLLSAILFLIISFASIWLVIYFDTVYIYLAPVLFIYGLAQPLTTWLSRKQQYNKLNVYRFILAITTPLFSLLFSIVFHWRLGLVAGFIIGQLSGLLFLLISFKNIDIKLITFSNALKYLRQYKQFPTFAVLSSLTGSFSRNAIVLFIERFFGVLNAGYYTMATRMLSAPVGIYQSALSQIYAQQATVLSNTLLKAYTKKMIWFSFLMGIVPVIILLFFGEDIFRFFFGINWQTAGRMAQYIVVWFFSMGVINPVGLLIDIKQKLKFEFYWNIVLLIFRAAAILAGILLNDIFSMLLIISIVSVAMNIYLLRYVLKLTNVSAS